MIVLLKTIRLEACKSVVMNNTLISISFLSIKLKKYYSLSFLLLMPGQAHQNSGVL